MYLAELHGKLSSKLEGMEDLLTSNVFSFFKYSTRKIFLKSYLAELGLLFLTKRLMKLNLFFGLDMKRKPNLIW